MDREAVRALLEDVQAGRIDVDAAVRKLRRLPYEDLGFAKLDHHRALRNGFPEVVLGEGKDAAQIVTIAERLQRRRWIDHARADRQRRKRLDRGRRHPRCPRRGRA